MSQNGGNAGDKKNLLKSVGFGENRENESPVPQVEKANIFTDLTMFERYMEQVFLSHPEKRSREVLEPDLDHENIPTKTPPGPTEPPSSTQSPKRIKVDPEISPTPGNSSQQTPPSTRVLQELSTNTPSVSRPQSSTPPTPPTPKIQTAPKSPIPQKPKDKSLPTLGTLRDNLTSPETPRNFLQNPPKELSQSQRIQALEAQQAIERADNIILTFFFNTLEKIPVSLIHKHARISQSTLEDFLRLHNVVDAKRKTLTGELAKFPATTSAQEGFFQGFLSSSTPGGSQTKNTLTQGPSKSFNYDEYERSFKNDGETDEFNESDPQATREIWKILRQIFNLEAFRPSQLQAINAAIADKDCFIQMPTGGGKSLCFHLPALISPGITFIISPLISLINDQVQKLVSLDIPAVHLLSSLSTDDEAKIYKTLLGDSPPIKMVFVTPEKIASSYNLNKCFDSLYDRNLLSRFVIDEAHCVSSWGHDFRPDYVKLNVLRHKYPQVPIMALTASATKFVRCDVLHQLQMSDTKWFIQSLNRPNLKYKVLEKTSKKCMADVTQMIKSRFLNDTGIVYCLARKECEEYAEYMDQNGVNAAPYHADISAQQKCETQGKWLSGDIKVIVATIAFGMGIDKPNVRYVIHAVLPKSIEGYYQESGRAGRDGELAECILYYSHNDIARNRFLVGKETDGVAEEVIQAKLEGLNKMVAFCENMTECRRTMQLDHFGEEFNREECSKMPESICDNCGSNRADFEVTNVIREAREIVKGVDSLNKSPINVRLTATKLAAIFRGCDSKMCRESGATENPVFGIGKGWSQVNVYRLINKLLLEKYLEDKVVINKKFPVVYIKVGSKAQELMADNAVFEIAKMSNYTTVNSSQQRVTNGDVRRFSDGAGTSQPRPLTNGDTRRYSYNGGGFTQPRYTTTSLTPKEQEWDALMKDLGDRCYKEVSDFISVVAEVWGKPSSYILPPVAVRFIAEKLPLTEENMLRIPYVTQEIFNECLIPVLEITNTYEEEKTELRKKILAEF